MVETLREERRLRLFENMYRIFGPKGDQNKEWRRLHNEELHSLYRSPNIKSRILRSAGHTARMEEGRNSFQILTGKPTGKRHLGRPRGRWEENIRSDLKERDVNTRNWIDSTQIGIIGEPLWMRY